MQGESPCPVRVSHPPVSSLTLGAELPKGGEQAGRSVVDRESHRHGWSSAESGAFVPPKPRIPLRYIRATRYALSGLPCHDSGSSTASGRAVGAGFSPRPYHAGGWSRTKARSSQQFSCWLIALPFLGSGPGLCLGIDTGQGSGGLIPVSTTGVGGDSNEVFLPALSITPGHLNPYLAESRRHHGHPAASHPGCRSALSGLPCWLKRRLAMSGPVREWIQAQRCAGMVHTHE
jgi:hypothetical protein